MPPAIRTREDLASALSHLARQDRLGIGRILRSCGDIPLRTRPADFAGLVWIVISQQVSTASAEAIHTRVRLRFADLQAGAIARASDEELKSCGLSMPKIRTLRALAAAVLEERLQLEALASLPAEAARDALMAVKGIGPWTADIFLLFCLGHPDVWPAGDLALQEALRMALGLEVRPNAKAAEALAEPWRPWRGVAARVLWAWYRVARQSGTA